MYTKLFLKYVIEYSISKLNIKPLQILNTNFRGICKLTGNNCKFPDMFCITNFTNNDYTNVLNCPYFKQNLESYTVNQLISAVLFRNFLDYQILLTEKFNVYEAVSIVLINAFSKDSRDISLTNNNPLLEALFRVNDLLDVKTNSLSKSSNSGLDDSKFWYIHQLAEQVFEKYIPNDFNEFHFKVMVKNEYQEYLDSIREAWIEFTKVLDSQKQNMLQIDYEFWKFIANWYIEQLNKHDKAMIINSVSTFKWLMSYPMQFLSSVADIDMLEKQLDSVSKTEQKVNYKVDNFLKKFWIGKLKDLPNDTVLITKPYLTGYIDEFRKSKILNQYSCQLERYIYTENTFTHLMFYIDFKLDRYLYEMAEIVKLIDYMSEPIFESKGLTDMFKKKYPKLAQIVNVLESRLNENVNIENQSLNK